MACYHPLDAFVRVSGRSGKAAIFFEAPGEAIQVPCGQCIGCRLDRSLNFAVRMMHEVSLHEDNCFITLTYDEEHYPTDGSLVKHHFQDFMKRLRRHFEPRRIRFYHCGEYGGKFKRPHYHAVLFGVDFADRQLFSIENGVKCYTSALLAERWGKGFCTVGDVTFESAAYVARYCMKKVTGDDAVIHYVSEDGVMLQPEYATMSRRPGIGSEWFSEFANDVFPWDEVISSGRPLKPPRYYDNLYRAVDEAAYFDLKVKRMEKARKMAKDNTPERLRSREIVKKAQLGMLKRRLDDVS